MATVLDWCWSTYGCNILVVCTFTEGIFLHLTASFIISCDVPQSLCVAMYLWHANFILWRAALKLAGLYSFMVPPQPLFTHLTHILYSVSDSITCGFSPNLKNKSQRQTRSSWIVSGVRVAWVLACIQSTYYWSWMPRQTFRLLYKMLKIFTCSLVPKKSPRVPQHMGIKERTDNMVRINHSLFICVFKAAVVISDGLLVKVLG